MQLVCYDDSESQALHLNPYLSSWTAFTPGDDEAQPLWLSVTILPDIRDACRRLVLGPELVEDLLLNGDLSAALRIPEELEQDITIAADGDFTLELRPNCEIEIDAEILSAVESVLGLGRQGCVDLELSLNCAAVLGIPSDAALALDLYPMLSHSCDVKPEASVDLLAEVCDE